METASNTAATAATKTQSLPTPLYWLALGAFAVGTEGFMIAPLLPGLATDLKVSIETAGQLVTVFALAYGLSSPILTALTGSLNRRTLLLLSMTAFTLSNILAWRSDTYWALMGARILLAFSAGLYVPGAHALASALVPPERRGRALAVVNGGMTVAIALGVPLGAILGHALGWRMTFAGVAVLAAIATGGLVIGLPKGIGAGIPTANLRERIAVIRKPVILMTLLVTTLWATGAYTIYTYLSGYLTAITGLEGAQISVVLFLWGVSAAVGVTLGGNLNDKFGPMKVVVPTISFGGLAFLSMTLTADYLPPSATLMPVVAAVVVWGIAHWAFYPAQQARLIEIAGLKVASIVLSLNASFMYIGFSAGAALGALTLAKGSVNDLGWVASLCEVAALALTLALARRPSIKICPA